LKPSRPIAYAAAYHPRPRWRFLMIFSPSSILKPDISKMLDDPHCQLLPSVVGDMPF
jgi:hypothetical protein